MTSGRRPTAPLGLALAAVLLGGCAVVGAAASPVAPPVGSPPAPAASLSAIGRLTWHDEFSGRAGSPPDPRSWTPLLGVTGGATGSQRQSYTGRSQNLGLDGHGHLAITVRQEQTVGLDGLERPYSSARISTAGHVEPRFGRIEARILLPSSQGLWPAFWLLGSDFAQVGSPASGEMDILETKDRAHRAFSYVHYPSDSTLGVTVAHQRLLRGTAISPGWHTYSVTWDEHTISMAVDGHEHLTLDLDSLPERGRLALRRSFSIVLNVAVEGGFASPVDPTSVFPATMLVDWVRVYARRAAGAQVGTP